MSYRLPNSRPMNCVEQRLLASLITGPAPALGVGEIPYFMLPAYRHSGHASSFWRMPGPCWRSAPVRPSLASSLF